MSIEDYISQKFGALGYTPSAADLLDISFKSGVSLSDELTADNVELLGVGILYFIPELLARPQSISESGFSVSWNVEGIKKWYSYLCHRYGIEDELSDAPSVAFL